MSKIETFYIKQNDRQPNYTFVVKDSDGDVVNIAGATIVCTMKNVRAGTIKINRQSTGISITDGANGEAEYQWQSGDTDTVGKYHIEFEIDPVVGEKFTLPVDPKDVAEVFVVGSLDTT